MQKVSAQDLQGKKILIRMDFDVPVKNGKVVEDFRLKAGLPTLKLALENGTAVVAMGHLGRPEGKFEKDLSVEAIYDWLSENGFSEDLQSKKLQLLENLRFEAGEDSEDPDYAKSLASYGEVFINESFAAYHKAASTTVLPTLLPSFAGLRFYDEVEKLRSLKDNPPKPLVSIIGGAKIKDKLPSVLALSKISDMVLVGGKLPSEIKEENTIVPHNVFVAKVSEDGLDITSETLDHWTNMILKAATILWNGPMGKIDPGLSAVNLGSGMGTYNLAHLILSSKAQIIVGGGDTVGFLGDLKILDEFEKKGFVSTGGGAMLEYLVNGTLPTIEALS